jgi:hypothetical protein
MSEDNNNSPDGELQQKAIQWLSKKWPIEKRNCDVCGHMNWQIQPFIVTPLILKDGIIQIMGHVTTHPQVMAICTNCTNTKYFNAALMGIAEKKKDGGQDGKE